MSEPRAAVSWSGGKDACLALHTVREAFHLVSAVTMMDETGERNRSHGLRADVLRAQVASLGLAWVTRPCSWDSYEDQFVDALRETARDGVTHLICGDLLYPEHRAWVERVCAAAGLTAVEPLFGTPTREVLASCLDAGIVARIIAVDATKLGPEWLFRELSTDAAHAFDQLGVDPCGEHGEYHTVVTHCPAFAAAVPLLAGEQVRHRGYWAIDVRLALSPLPVSAGGAGASSPIR
jgi:diphthine-ammonia ligase